MNTLTPRYSLQATLLATLLIALISAPAAVANTYSGRIWGHVTVATDSSRSSGATLPLFGINAPVFEGDPVSGFYSYDSPTRDVDLFSAHNINITLTIGNPANTLPYIGHPELLYQFNVSGGNLTFFSVIDSSDFGVFTFISTNETAFHLIEEDNTSGPDMITRSLQGILRTSKVPETESTWGLTLLTLGALLFFKSNRSKSSN